MRIKFAESDKFPKNNVERRPNRLHNAVNTRHQNDKYLTWRRIEGTTNWSNREIFFFLFLFFFYDMIFSWQNCWDRQMNTISYLVD